MRSNARMANRQGDVDLPFAQVSTLSTFAWLGLAWPSHSLYLPVCEDGTDSVFLNVGI